MGVEWGGWAECELAESRGVVGKVRVAMINIDFYFRNSGYKGGDTGSLMEDGVESFLSR